MATRRPKAVEDDADAASASQYKPDMLALLGTLEQIVKVNAISLSEEDRMSTGMLTLDLILGGGVCPGMYTFFGPEQSAKTTTAITILGASVSQEVDLRVLWDAENSSGSSIDYVTSIFNNMGVKVTVEKLFGVRKDGVYLEAPIVYYRDDYEGEKFFNWLHALEKRLPDKRFEDGRWWYVYDDDDAKLKAKLGGAVDRAMTRKQQAGLWIPAKNGSLQAVVLLDSYPSLVPSSMDEDEGDKAIAVQARMFGIQLPRVKGALRAKRIALIGINQLSINPMARFSNPETEKGGNALKTNSDVRLRMFPRSSGQPYNPKVEKGREREPSLWGPGEDVYRYIHVSQAKNKLSVPGRETWLRLIERGGDGVARGFCTVFDTWHYLVQTGQATGKRNSMRLALRGVPEARRAITWMEFKKLIIGSKEQRKEVADALGWARPIDVRAGCFSQIRKGVAEKLYHEFSASATKNEDDDE